jgi:hypothetical protein
LMCSSPLPSSLPVLRYVASSRLRSFILRPLLP